MKFGKLAVLGLLFCSCGGQTTPPRAPNDTQAEATSTTTAPTNPAASDSALPADVRAIIDATDRAPEDRALDKGRHPGELLAFLSIRPGMKIAEIAAGGGYTTELLARAVGPTGVVYGQNTKWVLEKFAEKPWSARLAKPTMKNVVRVDRELDDPLPPEAKNLDVVVNVLFYHDTFWMKADRDKMNKAIFNALKPGGVYAVVDHSGRNGTGSNEVQSLHRIEEKVVRDEIEKAGFKFAEEGRFLRNASDTRDWNAAPFAAAEKRGTSDRFVYKFTKP